MTTSDPNEYTAITAQLVDSLRNRSARVLRRCAGTSAAELSPGIHIALAQFYDSEDVGALLKLAQACSKQQKKIKKADDV